MFVYKAFPPDPRVHKQARSLTAAGYDVSVVALGQAGRPDEEVLEDGVSILRVVKSHPVNQAQRAFWWGPNLARAAVTAGVVGTKRLLGLEIEDGGTSERARGQESSAAPTAAGRPAAGVANGGDEAGSFVRSWARLPEIPYRYELGYVGSRGLGFLDFYVRAALAARRLGAHVFHAHDLNTLPVAHYLAQRTGGKLVYDSHELYVEAGAMADAERSAWRWLEARLIQDCDAVFTVCPSIAQALASRYGVREPEILRNCPPRRGDVGPRDHFRETLGLPASERIVLYQGGYSPNRGLLELIEAARSFPDGATLVMMGWGAVEGSLREQVERDGLTNRVRFLPPVSQEVLLDWTASADVGVIPFQAANLNNYFSCPNKLFEYLQAGIPVATSNYPELSRVVVGDGVGRTFDPASPTAIAAAVAHLLEALDDPELAERLRRARARYCWEVEEATLLRTYEALLPGAARSPA